VKFDITGGGEIIGVDNGQQESKELYKWGNVDANTHSERSAFNGKVLVIVRAIPGGGDIKLTVSSDYMVPVTLSVGRAAGSKPSVSLKTPSGAASAEGKTFLTRVGEVPALPTDVKVTYANGVTLIKKVAWELPADSAFDGIGQIEITGKFEDTSIADAKAVIKVLNAPEKLNAGLNPDADIEDYQVKDKPLATATFSTSTMEIDWINWIFTFKNELPNSAIDGKMDTAWSNWAASGATVVLDDVVAARPFDSIETYWPTEQTISDVALYFAVGETLDYEVPSAVSVWRWDGFNWVEAEGTKVEFASADGEATLIDFDDVVTTRLRVVMESAHPFSDTSGRIKLYEFESYSPDFANSIAATPTPTPTPTSAPSNDQAPYYPVYVAPSAPAGAAATPAKIVPPSVAISAVTKVTAQNVVSIAQPIADALYSMNILYGTSADSAGKPVYALEKSLTRMEALAFVIRLQGLEAEANAFKGANPFKDTPEWGSSLAAYAYSKGITFGIDDAHSIFDPDAKVTYQQFTAFLLRVLNYHESSDDFAYENALQKAVEINMYGKAEVESLNVFSSYIRAHAVMSMADSLYTPIKGSDKRLIDMLVENGIVSSEAAKAFGK
jgi:hypothetical protein